ncbi:MAG: DUF3667 domain-containing protein [Wenzhouxiangella sp.]|nr:MAG: DUF3667 domain-containing protein [Wenzhouxiangella sp.]
MQATDETSAKPGRDRPQRDCNNCGTRLTGPYCHRCGQPARSFIRALPGLVGEIATETLYYDSRMWRTLQCLLFKPGWLSREYVTGKRARYTPPVRLYLISSIVAFLVITLVVNTAELSGVPDEAANEFTSGFADGSRGAVQFGSEPWHAEDNPVRIDWLGARGNAWLNRQIALIDGNAREAVRNPARFVRTAAGMLPQTMFVILPLFSAWVGVFYLFAQRYYIEHLLLQVHNHAFVFLSLVGLYLIALARDLLGEAAFFGHASLSGLLYWIGVVIWLWIPFYVLISIRRFYRQGWALTLIKFLILIVSYFIMLLFALLAVIVLGVWRL